MAAGACDSQRVTSSPPDWLACLHAEVRARLREQHSTRIALAVRVGITPSHLSSVLTGRVAGSPQLLTAIAEAVGLRIVVALGDAVPPLPPGKWKRGKEPEG